MFGFICKLRKRHLWEAFEVYDGEWFLVCAICKAVHPLNGREVDDDHHETEGTDQRDA